MADLELENRMLRFRIKELEKELARSVKKEHAFRSLVEDNLDIMYRTDAKGLITYISPSVTAISGYTVEEAIGMNMAEEVYYHPHEREHFLKELMKDGVVRGFTCQLKRKDGSLWWASTNAHFSFDEQGQVTGVEGITRDITESVEADLELRQIFNMSIDMICIADLETATFTKINPAFTETLGFTEDELLGRTFLDFIHPDDVQDTIDTIENILKKGKAVARFKNRYLCKDGGYKWLRWVSHPKVDTGMTYATAHDITEEINSAEALRQSEERFRNVIESCPMGVFLYELKEDDRLVLTAANKATKEILGITTESLLGLTIEEAFPPLAGTEIPDVYRNVCRTGEGWNSEQVMYHDHERNISGAYVVYAFQTSPGKTAIFFLDITERKKAEEEKKKLQEQLVQAQKMEAVGTLAGGVAHDFNNMLGGIIGAAEMLSLYLPGDGKAEKFHRLIIEAAGRAADLTGKLLTFSRNSPRESSAVDVHEVISETVVLLENTIDKRIKITVSFKAESSVLIGDASQLQSAFLNLGINSSHAMPDGGTIEISTETQVLDPVFCEASTFHLIPGEYIEIGIRDTGCGIKPDHLSRLFEPFFTTKEQGRGTGLGLAAVYGTVQQHNGSIIAYSEVGVGTTFQILLPVAEGNQVVKESIPRTMKGEGRILIVDDEKVMRETAKAILEDLGYDVLVAENGREGLDFYRAQQDRIDLVILDMIMPVMNGRDCFYLLRESDPDVRVILSSGFTQEDDLETMRSDGLCGFIHKPYRRCSLSQVVHGVLSAGVKE